MTIAYLILAHAHPEQLIRMMARLRVPGTTFAVHVDGRAEASVRAEVARCAAEHDDVLLAEPQRCYWGTYALVQATLECIGVLLASGRAFDYAVLLSGQDYPIKRPEHVANFFAEKQGAQFIEAFPLDAPNRWTPQGGRFQAMARVNRYTWTVRSRILQLPLPRRFPLGWRPHGGSQWWALSREALLWVLQTLRESPRVTRYFRHTFIPDEAMFQTMLANSPFAERMSAETLHYIDWERPNPKYPRTLEEEDFDRLAASSALFARKMHPQRSAGLLERVDSQLL
jgi:hypothetical protein